MSITWKQAFTIITSSMFINSEISTRSVPWDLVKAYILSKWRRLLSPQQVTLWPFLDDSWPLSPKDELPVLEYKCSKNMGPIRLSLSKVLLRSAMLCTHMSMSKVRFTYCWKPGLFQLLAITDKVPVNECSHASLYMIRDENRYEIAGL